jgi:hypothetical protein
VFTKPLLRRGQNITILTEARKSAPYEQQTDNENDCWEFDTCTTWEQLWVIQLFLMATTEVMLNINKKICFQNEKEFLEMLPNLQ